MSAKNFYSARNIWTYSIRHIRHIRTWYKNFSCCKICPLLNKFLLWILLTVSFVLIKVNAGANEQTVLICPCVFFLPLIQAKLFLPLIHCAMRVVLHTFAIKSLVIFENFFVLTKTDTNSFCNPREYWYKYKWNEDRKFNSVSKLTNLQYVMPSNTLHNILYTKKSKN